MMIRVIRMISRTVVPWSITEKTAYSPAEVQVSRLAIKPSVPVRPAFLARMPRENATAR